MIRVFVVEDEPLARRHLVAMLSELPGIQVLGEASDGLEGLAALQTHQPDVVFLDIEMPGLTGMELLRCLPIPRPKVIFVTAYAEHAVQAFGEGATHYLLKPISRVDLAQALSRVRPQEDPLQKAWLRIPARRRDRRCCSGPRRSK